MLGSKGQRTEGIRRQAQELIDQAYERGFKAGKEAFVTDENKVADKAYQKGLDDAWETARKICTNWCISDACLAEIFGKGHTIDDIMRLNSASEAIAKIKEFEEKQKKAESDEIMIGDEVIGKFGFFRGVVVGIDLQSQKASVLNVGYTLPQTYSLNGIDRTTGRHFPQIAEVLKQLQEGEGCRC